MLDMLQFHFSTEKDYSDHTYQRKKQNGATGAVLELEVSVTDSPNVNIILTVTFSPQAKTDNCDGHRNFNCGEYSRKNECGLSCGLNGGQCHWIQEG